MAFNPAEYLAKKTTFDPVAYLASKTPKESPTMLDSAARGAVNELTLGGAPKIAGAFASPVGAGKSLLELLGADYSSDPDVQNYEKEKNLSKAAFDNAQSANPYSYGAGQLAGGIGLGALSGGLGLFGEAGEAANYGSKLLNAAKMGTAFGAAHGAIGSEGNNLIEKAKDAGMGGVAGAITAPIATMGMDALGYGAGKFLGKKAVNAFKLGENGENLIGDDAKKAFINERKQSGADELASQFDALKNKVSKAFGDQQADTADMPVHMDDAVSAVQSHIDSLDDRIPTQLADKTRLQQLLDNFTSRDSGETPDLTANDALKLKQGMQDYSRNGRGLSSTNGEFQAGQATNTVGQTLESQVPGYAEVNNNYHTLQENILKPLGLKGSDDFKTNKSLRGALWKADTLTGIGSETDIAIQNALDSVKTIDPELAASMQKTFDGHSLDIQTARQAGNVSFNSAGKPMEALHSSTVSTMNALGQVSRVLTIIPKQLLGNIGQGLMNNSQPIYQKLGTALVNASQRDDIGRNAILFTLMQNESYRGILGGLFENGGSGK